MKFFYQALILLGVALLLASGAYWAKAGFPVNSQEFLVFFIRKSYTLKESYFFYMSLGMLMITYGAIELNLKRWDK